MTNRFGSINALPVSLGLGVILHSGCISLSRNTPALLPNPIIVPGIATAPSVENLDLMPVGMSASDLTAAARQRIGGDTSHMLDI